MISSQGTVNSMHLLLLHPSTLVKNDGTMYKPMNQVLHKEEIHPRRLVFSDRQCRVNEDSQFVTFVLFKLFQTGCKFFVQNMALRLYSGKKAGIHCDLVGYHRKNDQIFIISYARTKNRIRRSWMHLNNFHNVIQKVISPHTTVKKIVVPFHIYKNSKRIFFRNKDPFQNT